jgi:N-acetylglutamate synthase-like GNAT family acetyltransferase
MDGLLVTVIIGLIGAGIVWSLNWTIKWVRDKLREREFSIAGTYSSTFEDPADRDKDIKATAKLKQRGLHVSGETVALHDHRIWQLDGQIDRGRLYGTYEAEDRSDVGLGGFFLNIKSPGEFEGVWAGFDARTCGTTTGAYRFRRMITVDVRQMGPKDVDGALSVLGAALGRKYIEREDLEAVRASSDGRPTYVALVKGTVVGALTAELADRDTFLQRVPGDMVDAVVRATPGLEYQRIGLIRSVAVADAEHRGGIGTQLVQAAIKELWKLGATVIIAVAWADQNSCRIAGVLEAFGFKRGATLPSYWQQDSQENSYECPVCGNPCKCSAILYLLMRGDSPD